MKILVTGGAGFIGSHIVEYFQGRAEVRVLDNLRSGCRTICRLTGSKSEIKHAAERAGDVKHSMAAVEKLNGTGFTAQGNLSDGLKATVDFFKSKLT